MGKSKDKKKKGLGMEKTMAKTEKKIQKNIKKELEEIGEDDVEKLIAAFNEKERELNQVKENVLLDGKFPSRRGGATFNLLPEKDELILFGGEYFNGHKVAMFNDLYVYSIKKNQWTLIKAPNGPPPRTFHQTAVVSRNGGELWVFGGEFSSPSQSQFYHYNDLWCFSFQTKQWTKINAPNGPSARSGHRMVVLKKHLIIFGGYYDNLRNCRFYNDVYAFNLDTNQWDEMKFSNLNDQPSPRSACQLSVCTKNNSIVMYGGFSKEKLKKEKEKGITYSDMYVLQSEVKKNDKIEWFWKRVKQTGIKPSERISFSMISINEDTSLLFGGVHDLKDEDENDDDDDDEEENKLNSIFFNDLYKLDLTTFKWTLLKLRGKKELKTKKQKESEMEVSNDKIDMNESDMTVEIEDEPKNETVPISVDQLSLETKDDSPFQLTITAKEATEKMDTVVVVQNEEVGNQPEVFLPHPRRSSYLQFHKGILYLFGGKFEDIDDKEITLNDLYSLNIKKLDEWNVLYEDPEFKLELKKSVDSENEEEKENDDSEESESDFEIDAPKPNFPTETIEDYFNRTNELWLTEAANEFPDEKSKKFLKKVAFEICQMFWDKFKDNNNNADIKSSEPVS